MKRIKYSISSKRVTRSAQSLGVRVTSSNKAYTRTVFVRADRYGVRGGSVPHTRPGQHPDPVLGPALELINHKRRSVQLHLRRLGVAAPGLHDVQLVVDDAAVAALRRRGLPAHTYRCGALGHSGDVLRRRPRHWKYPPQRANVNEKHNRNKTKTSGRIQLSIQFKSRLNHKNNINIKRKQKWLE